MEMIVDGKTVSLRHYLNKTLKPKLSDQGETLYPLYTIVVYQRKNTTFKTFRDIRSNDKSAVLVSETNEPLLSDNSLEKFLPDVYSTDKLILEVIEKDIARSKQTFQLKGVKEKIEKLSFSLDEVVSICNEAAILEYFKNHLTYSKFVEIYSRSKTISEFIQIYYRENPEVIKEYNGDASTRTNLNLLALINWLTWWQSRNGRISLFDWFYKGRQYEAEQSYCNFFEYLEDTNPEALKYGFEVLGENHNGVIAQEKKVQAAHFFLQALSFDIERIMN
ncbi:MAG TPA: hypothetical protein PLZ12_02215 [Saprospiraceae bacterium]|nr:hypothetical protein [Saprospiraceae bacterium]